MRFRTACLLAFALAGTVGPLSAQAPCGGWDSTFASPGPDHPFEDYATFDDGSGPALYAAGQFTTIGADRAHGVVRWDGSRWHQVGNLIHATDVTVFDDGAGPKLYAVASIAGIAVDTWTLVRFDGASWTNVLGSGSFANGSRPLDVASFDDGTGPALYLAGNAFGIWPGYRVARWDGVALTPFDAGLQSATFAPSAIAVFDAGSGPTLYLGGSGPSQIRRWDGASWQEAGSLGIGVTVQDLIAYSGLAPNALYAVGTTNSYPSAFHGIARLDGTTWSGVYGGLDHALGIAADVRRAVVHDDGTGPKLVVAGDFDRAAAGGIVIDGLASWDGANWSALDPGLDSVESVSALASFDDGQGPALHLGGTFSRIGRAQAANAAVLRSGSWVPVADGNAPPWPVSGLCVFDDGHGTALFASSYNLGSSSMRGVARWDGSTWTSLGNPEPLGTIVYDVAAVDGGTGAGAELYAFGVFTRMGGVDARGIARWDGASWHPLGTGIAVPSIPNAYPGAYSIAAFDDGSGTALYVGGLFLEAGGAPAANIARWDGTSWSALGSGLNGWVADLVTFDDGTGVALYACGDFTTAGGVAADGIARWDGTSWSAVGTQILDAWRLLDLQVYDDGSGPALFVSAYSWGYIDLSPGVHSTIARWDGTSWTGWPGSLQNGRMGVFHDGTKPLLCMTQVGATSWTREVHTFDGVAWDTLHGDIGGDVDRFVSWDREGDGVPDLYAAGLFWTAGGGPSVGLARYLSCGTRGENLCAGDGSVTTCPCAGVGEAGHGCPNSVHPGGAGLSNGGIASLGSDTLTLRVERATGSFAIYVQGTQVAGGTGVPFQDGVRCVGGTVARLGTSALIGGASAFPRSGAAGLAQLGLVTAPGDVRVYQAIYRNQASFCTSGAANATNGLRVTWSL